MHWQGDPANDISGSADPHQWREELLALVQPTPAVFRRPLAFLDIETTGTDPTRHVITDIAILREDLRKGGSALYVDTWHSKIKVSEWDLARASPEALRITGFRAEEWADAPTLSEVLPEIVRRITGCGVVGHNVQFDLGFLAVLFEGAGIPRSCLPPVAIDTYSLAKGMLAPLGLRRFGLDKCNEFLGLPREGEHRALGGAEACKRLFDELAALATEGFRARQRRTGRAPIDH